MTSPIPDHELSRPCHNVLQFMLAFHDEHGWAPTVREIADATDYRSTSGVANILSQLAAAGYIRMAKNGQARAIDLRPAILQASV